MNARLAQTGIPGASLGSGTKWREASDLFAQWNQPEKYTYISAFLVSLLDHEQWVTADETRMRAMAEVEDILKPASLRLHNGGYPIPTLLAKDPVPSVDNWDNEAFFREKVVEPLLRRTRGVFNVIHTHGRDEYGRDFVFDYAHRLLSERRWVAIQVKAGDVSGAAGSTLRVLVDQVQTAFEHPFIDLGTMGRVTMAEVLILISGRFTHNAKDRILESIKDPVWRANIAFLDRNGVEALIRRTALANVI